MISPGLGTVMTILAAFWVAIAVVLTFVAWRRLNRATALVASARSVASLLRSVPARPLLVHADGAIEADSLLQRDLGLAEPIPLGEGLLLDDLVEPLAKRLVSRLGVMAGEFAELVAAAVILQVIQGMEDWDPEAINGLLPLDQVPQPIAPGTLDLWVVPQVAEACPQERSVIETACDRPLRGPTKPLLEGIPLLTEGWC